MDISLKNKVFLKVPSQLYLAAGGGGTRFAAINHVQHLKIIRGAIKIATKILWCAIMFLPSEHH